MTDDMKNAYVALVMQWDHSNRGGDNIVLPIEDYDAAIDMASIIRIVGYDVKVEPFLNYFLLWVYKPIVPVFAKNELWIKIAGVRN